MNQNYSGNTPNSMYRSNQNDIQDNINNIKQDKVITTDTAYFAGGCFWGVEYMMQKMDGVILVESGFMGGYTKNPSYREVCTGNTGHAETVKIVFDTTKCKYHDLCKMFFEIHDPTQKDGQGPDIGSQYRSEIFYTNENQKNIAQQLIDILKSKGYKVTTKLTPASIFWKAEDYHQNYYERKGTRPYCHAWTKRF